MLHARWLGRVPYEEADRLQRAFHERAGDDYLLLLEHPHVYTLGVRAKLEPLRGKLVRLVDRGWLRKLPDGRFTTRL